jgi:hypothetical protein
MKMAMRRVRALKEELAGIEETEGEVEALMTHVNSMEEILRSTKKPFLIGIQGGPLEPRRGQKKVGIPS